MTNLCNRQLFLGGPNKYFCLLWHETFFKSPVTQFKWWDNAMVNGILLKVLHCVSLASDSKINLQAALSFHNWLFHKNQQSRQNEMSLS